MTALRLLEHDRGVGGADSTMPRGLTAAFRRVRGVVGRRSPRDAELGTWAEVVSAGLGGSLRDDDEATLLVACAWCGRYRLGCRWRALAAVPESGRVSHGICPSCFASVGGNAFR